ncbi:MAG: alkaline phosphatase family protein [Pirellulales bacterium]
MRKKVLLIVIDALATRVVAPALQDGRLPNFKRLVDAGWMHPGCVPIFPSITPAATAGIVTGCYPRDTGITGAHFYDTAEDAVYYYGDDFWIILEKGIGEFFDDFLKKLNLDLLKQETLFERVERAGLRAGCINYLWFRGDTEHAVNVPWLLRLLPGVPKREAVRGPRILCLGDFVTSKPKQMDEELEASGGPFHRFGFDDSTTAEYLLELVAEADLPDFTLAYFPDNDFRSHEVGPQQAIDSLQAIDKTLGKLIDQLGGLERMLSELAVVITGDHSQTDMRDLSGREAVDLNEVLQNFELVDAGKSWDSDDELMVCPNMRAAQIYLRRGYWPKLAQIKDQLLADDRIDQVIWRGQLDDENHTTFHVATSERGEVAFRAVSEGHAMASDAYGGYWQWEGQLRAIDADVVDRRLQYGEYPNAMERIAMAFHKDVSGDLWITARPGFELHTPRTSRHPGGSHGSLHIDDSQVPLIVAGAPGGIALPEQPRTVDVAPLCLSILGLPLPRSIDASHVRERPDATG